MKPPSGLAVQATDATTSLTVTWKPVTKAENYRVQYSTSSKMTNGEVRALRRHHQPP